MHVEWEELCTILQRIEKIGTQIIFCIYSADCLEEYCLA